jgi:hypothetical protein
MSDTSEGVPLAANPTINRTIPVIMPAKSGLTVNVVPIHGSGPQQPTHFMLFDLIILPFI